MVIHFLEKKAYCKPHSWKEIDLHDQKQHRNHQGRSNKFNMAWKDAPALKSTLSCTAKVCS